MLYDRWRQVASEQAGQLALIDLASDRRWTFRQLAAAAEAADPPREKVLFPTGTTAQFILEVLRGWRYGCLVCPVESREDQPANLGCLPADITHIKITSATGGVPRLIAFTAAQISADARNIVLTMGLRREWPNLGVISLAHSYGFSNLVLPLLLHGIPLSLTGGALPELLRRGAVGLPGLTLAAVPALWQSWHDAGAI